MSLIVTLNAALSPRPLLWTTATYNQGFIRMSHRRLKNNTVQAQIFTVPLPAPYHSTSSFKASPLYITLIHQGDNSARNHLHASLEHAKQASFCLRAFAHASPLLPTCSPQGTCSSCFLSFSSSHKGMISKPCLTTKDCHFCDCRTLLPLFGGFIFYLAHTAVKLWFLCFFIICVSAGLFYSLLFPHFPSQEQQLAYKNPQYVAEGMGRWGDHCQK